ncbi:hypothetical protein QA584_17370 [Anaerocolumna sp. AGMB13025]|uniref:hypothetical protein n=1 Tax=Anaerocolumna sp. AGMB13025 TaxID=3039116 RepID=UPI00241EBC9E|nr:hypothetical protein [Anaerocolumna sp. AGMB13025]WFR55371.1 hypothetical protein QA584_17370 [Anaerocolumna sp. AGMB13025]
MNKLMGFFELQKSSLPTIPWKEYDNNIQLDSVLLWTIRSAVFNGPDLNLPRLVGVNSNEAKVFADELVKKLKNKGIVIYYPYFIAEKSGIINVFNDRTVIEAVKADLWNLVTLSDRDVTIQVNEGKIEYNGDSNFLKEEELKKLLDQVPRIKAEFRNYLIEGKSILLEWSFAFNCDLNKNPIGEQYLVFYEARTV